MYSSENIVWIKNVKRDKGENWAYEDVSCEIPFLLHWPTKKGGSASTPKVGDIIVLFQKVNFIEGKANKIVHFTHLVTPITEQVHIDKNSIGHQSCREVKLIAKPNPIHSIPNPGYLNFFKPNRGLTNPIRNLTNNKGLSEIETNELIWKLFTPFLCDTLENEIYIPENPVGIYGEKEGDKIIKTHINLELKSRNSKIVQLAKSNALIKGGGKIECECCGFDFLKIYGKIGDSFIECHHKIPISEGERITRIEDLALVCSNCHRMLHRKQDDGTYHNIETLSNLISKNFN
jgi:5-methylcytosine-specific restriction endonuclease McrA